MTGDLIVPDGDLILGSTAVTSTAAELNKLDGVGTLKQAGKETIYVPAAAMYPNTTNGCAALTQVELSNGPEIKCLDFDASSDENAQFSIAFPKSWNEGTITFQAFFTVTGTNTGTVAWGLSGVGIADNASCNTAFGTNVVATAKAHSGTSNDLDVTAESGAVTVASAAVDTMTFFQIMRDVSADDQSGDARLLGIKIFFTTDAANDAQELDMSFGYQVLGFGSFPNSAVPVDYDITYVIVAGGGGGGKAAHTDYQSGGGGAGGHVTGTQTLDAATAYTVTIGAGGALISGTGRQVGNDGTSSQISGVNTSSVGGGGGGAGNYTPSGENGRTGGSGGGGGAGDSGSGGAGTSGQGNAGGNARTGNPYGGGGGGGAGAVGGNASSSRAGAGGAGISTYSSYPGISSVCGGGGGCGYSFGGDFGLGGSGGGGAGGDDADATSGTANTGGGGGGGGTGNGNKATGAGGSGIVAIRYSGSQTATGGTVTTTGGYTYHVFTTSGTFTTAQD